MSGLSERPKPRKSKSTTRRPAARTGSITPRQSNEHVGNPCRTSSGSPDSGAVAGASSTNTSSPFDRDALPPGFPFRDRVRRHLPAPGSEGAGALGHENDREHEAHDDRHRLLWRVMNAFNGLSTWPAARGATRSSSTGTHASAEATASTSTMTATLRPDADARDRDLLHGRNVEHQRREVREHHHQADHVEAAEVGAAVARRRPVAASASGRSSSSRRPIRKMSTPNPMSIHP